MEGYRRWHGRCTVEGHWKWCGRDGGTSVLVTHYVSLLLDLTRLDLTSSDSPVENVLSSDTSSIALALDLTHCDLSFLEPLSAGLVLTPDLTYNVYLVLS